MNECYTEENTPYDIIISDAALAMLDTHVDILVKVSVKAAQRLADEIIGDIRSLSANPGRFPMYENRFITDNRYHKMLSAKRYLVLYEIDQYTVAVDYIVDCRQDYEWLFR